MYPTLNPGIRRRYRSRLKPCQGFPTAMAWIDLFFLLLLFIIMASSVVKISGVKIDLPQHPAAEIYPGNVQYIVTVTAATQDAPQGKIFYRDKVCTLDELRRQFNDIRNPAEQTIIIRADKSVPKSRLVDIALAAKEEGFKKAILAVDIPDKKPEMYFE